MYQELSALVRQLSLLAAQLQIGGEDLGNELKKMEGQVEKVGEVFCLHSRCCNRGKSSGVNLGYKLLVCRP